MTVDRNGWTARERAWAALVTAGVVGTALSPIRQFRRPVAERVDSFPLSYFPMFSFRLGDTWKLSYAVGVRADGSEFSLPYHVLGVGGVNQVRKQLVRAVRRGRAHGHAELLAARLAQRPDCAGVVAVRIVRGEFDLDACLLRRNTRPLEVEELAVAALPRREAAEVVPVTPLGPLPAVEESDTSEVAEIPAPMPTAGEEIRWAS